MGEIKEVEPLETKLLKVFNASFVRLDTADDSIGGVIVSECFAEKTSRDRQAMIADGFRKCASVEQQQLHVLLFGFTPEEYEMSGASVRVHRIRQKSDRAIELLIHGVYSDAAFVKDTLCLEKGVKATELEQSAGVPGMWQFSVIRETPAGVSVSFVAEVLRRDQHIRIMAGAVGNGDPATPVGHDFTRP